jgi:signal transduction histidine kinase
VKLETRMWLTGAVMPVLVMAAVLLGASRWFDHALESALDRALLAQAAIESVSLFDGPRNEPHLHMATSPLIDSVRGFAPRGSLFGPDGKLVMRYPPEARDPGARLVPDPRNAEPSLATGPGRVRTLNVTVRSPRGEPYALQFEATLTQLDAASATFRRLSFAALLLTALVLVLAQSLQARRLRRRLAELTRHAEALRDGELEHTLQEERDRDELAELRAVLGHATRALRETRDARERFVADAAHELRTPLTLLRTNIDLALRRERSHEELKATLVELREEVVRLSQLSTHLLDLAAIPQIREREPVDLAALVAQAAESARGEATQRGLSLTTPAREPVLANVDSEAIRGALDNLLSNALKYAKSEIALSVEATPEIFRVRVRDDGPGIPDHERELVFEPFHRARGAQPGAGLGLAIVRATARAHRGRAYVAEHACGAELVLELPR